LFEFHVTRETINFDLKIGQYTDQACRKKLYELFKANKNVFTKVVRRNGSFSPTWHLAFQKKIVEKSAYENYLESDGNSLDDIIEKRFNDLMENDLPKIQEVIEKAVL